MSVSALVLTYNEEVNLAACLRSLTWCNDVVVLDSYSTDKTESIARDGGARFKRRRFDDYANQRNFGLNGIEYENEWVLMVDADEIVSEELRTEIAEALRNVKQGFCLFRMRRQDYFMGRWIRHSSGYPTWFGRLVRVGEVHVHRRINEEYVTSGKVGYLDGHLIHHPFNKGFHAWLEKHNRYSTMEAEEMVTAELGFPKMRDLLHTDPSLRRRAVKNLVYTLPGRPVIMFLGLFFIRGGFLDGIPGLTFCVLRAFYEYMINCKVKELRLRQAGIRL